MDTAHAVLSSTARATLQSRTFANLAAARASMVTHDGIAISSSIRGIGRPSIHLRPGRIIASLREADLDDDLYFSTSPSRHHGMGTMQ